MTFTHPIAFTIQRKDLLLEISLVETGKLLLHEEIVPEYLDQLNKIIRKNGIQKDPIIIDKKSLVVLDGMHRVAALRNLGCRFICACLVDYRNPEIKVDRWCRTINVFFNLEDALKSLRGLGITLSRVNKNKIIKGSKAFLLVDKSLYRVSAFEPDTQTIFDVASKLDLWLRSNKYVVEYETIKEANEKLFRGEVKAIFIPPIAKKEQVLNVAKSGRVLSFKSTRHVIPARPLGVSVPLPLLQERNLNLYEVNRHLEEALNKKEVQRLSSGNIQYGRRYEEELFIFRDPL